MLFKEVVTLWLDIKNLPLESDITTMSKVLKDDLIEFVDWYYVGCDNPTLD